MYKIQIAIVSEVVVLMMGIIQMYMVTGLAVHVIVVLLELRQFVSLGEQ